MYNSAIQSLSRPLGKRENGRVSKLLFIVRHEVKQKKKGKRKSIVLTWDLVFLLCSSTGSLIMFLYRVHKVKKKKRKRKNSILFRLSFRYYYYAVLAVVCLSAAFTALLTVFEATRVNYFSNRVHGNTKLTLMII